MDGNPDPKRTRSRSAADGVVKVLLGLTIVALMAQGLLMLHWQVATLSSMPAKSSRKKQQAKQAQPDPVRALAERSRVASRFEDAIKQSRKRTAQQPRDAAAAAGGGGGGAVVYELSRDAVFDQLRTYYNKQGIRSEEYITIMALNQSDRAWAKPYGQARLAVEQGNLTEARTLLRQALDGLDARHLMGRFQLLELLSEVEFRAANPEEGRAKQKELDETRILIARVTVEALKEARNGLSASDGEQILGDLAHARDQREDLARVYEMFSGQGQDPEQAPQRAVQLLFMAGQAEEQGAPTRSSGL
jgi:hypothetical protein